MIETALVIFGVVIIAALLVRVAVALRDAIDGSDNF